MHSKRTWRKARLVKTKMMSLGIPLVSTDALPTVKLKHIRQASTISESLRVCEATTSVNPSTSFWILAFLSKLSKVPSSAVFTHISSGVMRIFNKQLDFITTPWLLCCWNATMIVPSTCLDKEPHKYFVNAVPMVKSESLTSCFSTQRWIIWPRLDVFNSFVSACTQLKNNPRLSL